MKTCGKKRTFVKSFFNAGEDFDEEETGEKEEKAEGGEEEEGEDRNEETGNETFQGQSEVKPEEEKEKKPEDFFDAEHKEEATGEPDGGTDDIKHDGENDMSSDIKNDADAATMADNDDQKSTASNKSDDQHMTRVIRTAKYKGDVVYVKFLKIPNFQIKNSTMRELRSVNRKIKIQTKTLIYRIIVLKLKK